MQLYDFPRSPNCRKVRVYLAEKGLNVPLQPVDLLAGEQGSPEFLRLNPFGAVPILELDIRPASVSKQRNSSGTLS
jgi:glutathione S-transferase